MTGSTRTIAAAALAAVALWAATALCGATARHVEVTDDTVVEIAARVRYTTVIVVPEDESILTFVCGDSEYWGLEGKANVALLKPMKEGIRTNVALITDTGRIYTLTAREGGEPDLKVYLHRPAQDADEEARIGTPLEAPTFVAASELADYERQAELARDQAREARRAAQELLEKGIEDFPPALSRHAAVRLPAARGGGRGPVAGARDVERPALHVPALGRPRGAGAVQREGRPPGDGGPSTTRTACTWRGTWSGPAGCRSASAG